MNQSAQGIFVARTPAAVFVRVVGRGACRNSEALRQFGADRLGEGYRRFYVDLLACEGMDSTFLGVFAGFGLALREGGQLTLVDLVGENLRAFNCLGLHHLASVQIQDRLGIDFPCEAEFSKLPGSDLSSKDRGFDALERAMLMLDCHEDLCRVDEHNEDLFREVKRFLREDISRHSPSRRKPAEGV
jgi:anti-anti-sigma regulatory factor